MEIQYLQGFYAVENDGMRNFRWMQNKATIKLGEVAEKNALLFTVGCPTGRGDCLLTIEGKKSTSFKLIEGWQSILIALDEVECTDSGEYNFCCNFILDTDGTDDRILSLMIGEIQVIHQEKLPDVTYRSGFYAVENDGIRDFRWMENEASIVINKKENADWIIFEVGYAGSMPIDFVVKGEKKIKVKLINGWQQLGFSLAKLFDSDEKKTIEFLCDYQNEIKSNTDSRCMSLMIGNVLLGLPSEYVKNSAELARGLFIEKRLKSYPTFLTYETVAKCNLRCAMCAVDESLNAFDNDRICGMDKTRKIYENLLPYSSKLQLHASGEVLMGEDFWKALDISNEYSKDHSLEVEIFTNGLLLTSKKRKAILESALTDLVISVDAATERTYKRIRGGDFHKLLTNIKFLVQENENYKNKLRITMAFVMMRENIEELPDFIRLAAELGVRIVSFWPLFSTGIDMPIKYKEDFIFYYKQQMLLYYPQLTMEKIKEARAIAEKLNVRIGINPCFEKEYSEFYHDDCKYPLKPEIFDIHVHENKAVADYEKKSLDEQDIESYKGCYLPWNTAFITTEGRFSPCLLLTYQGGIDSVLEKEFDEVWNSELMQSLRQHIMDGKVHSLCKNAQCIFVNKKF